MSFDLVPARERHATRRAVYTPCEVVRDRGFTRIARRILDLSTMGMQAELEDDVLTGERVYVAFQLPYDRSWIDAEAVVTRVAHGRRPSDCGRSVGIAFDLPRDVRNMMRRHLRSLPLTAPLRSTRIDVAATVRAIAAT